ncbi:MAG: methylated-DNA--[protein]-cysteine S-methyltransferase [Pelagibacteraceae bacterium]|jgi:methylated-DNA-[protein]-cysteine S-methyltransferase|nr:methylated-DNA--[protein]-cysteine S-methyltransferase [Pelagibacteraceae bacterium]MBT3901906.1 methylated-DNA--[protein]-cysteine S-methyltransferase [Pelagibacteraceae bacterium]MBT4645786.1 methylated-DNA--[protein]-cysteine S-methyltransferase [Pelagibacteraceae bacterium]MBT5213632.1 methylated-DNA--[protein]-cysteine S-methyltransferase [Pelagibacteraceae bacterium]MBT6197699.1 methylated-DNA--[protein]-cysteine S-methyltransferase [Pelagibacteraceae bacterium]
MNTLSFYSSIGWITLSEENSLITSVKFGKKKNKGKNAVLIKLKKQIMEFTKGKRKKFSVKLNIEGSALQKNIWKQLSKISYGTTKTYRDIAKTLRTSPRYVGNVCGQNNHLLVIPCHRVVRSDGTLGGFSGLGGIKLKKKLLQLEQS